MLISMIIYVAISMIISMTIHNYFMTEKWKLYIWYWKGLRTYQVFCQVITIAYLTGVIIYNVYLLKEIKRSWHDLNC